MQDCLNCTWSETESATARSTQPQKCTPQGSTRPKRLVGMTLQDAIDIAWVNMHQWVSVLYKDDGVSRVICTPKTRKDGVNYWCWGYHTTEGVIVWRHTRKEHGI